MIRTYLNIEPIYKPLLTNEEYRIQRYKRLRKRRYDKTPAGKLSRKRKAQNKLKRRNDLINRLKDRPCMDCQGWFNPWQMQFDHRERAAKVGEISKLKIQGRLRLYQEILKCDLICANCHSERTYKRQDWKHLQ